MKKKILSFMTVLLLTGSVYMTAFAEGESSYPPLPRNGGTAAELKSYGKIVYQKGTDTIKIDSDDLYMLADQIDQVKVEVTDQLEAMNTYFSTGDGIVLSTSEDINVVHAKPYEEDFVDPLDVNFDTLLEGIAVSQSVSQDVTAYGYPAGTELYKSAEGILTTDGSGKDTEKISVAAATADDLSAGTAAWVDGHLILGTGKCNKDYYETGVNKFNGDSFFTSRWLGRGEVYTFSEPVQMCYILKYDDSENDREDAEDDYVPKTFPLGLSAGNSTKITDIYYKNSGYHLTITIFKAWNIPAGATINTWDGEKYNSVALNIWR